MRNFFLFIVVIATLSFTITTKVTASTDEILVSKGQRSPQFLYENLSGRMIGLNDFKGKYVFINLWATECEPCKEELQAIESLKKVYSKNIKFVSISVDNLKNKDKWKEFITVEKLSGTQLLSDKSWHSSFIRAYNVRTIPRYILISPDGMIVDTHAPRPSQRNLIRTFQKLNIQ